MNNINKCQKTMDRCNNCKHFSGDCGHHYFDKYDNTFVPDLPSIDVCESNGNCRFYERTK